MCTGDNQRLGLTNASVMAAYNEIDGFRRFIVENPIEVAEDLESILARRFGHESRDVASIANEDDLLLIAFNAIKHGTEVAGDLGDRKRLHVWTVSDRI